MTTDPATFNFAPFWRLYEAGGWEPATRDWVRDVTKPGDVFVDVGAWCGPVSLWALDAGAHVIAVEPDPVAAAELRRVLQAAIDNGNAELWVGALVADGKEGAWLAPSPRAGGQLGDSQSLLAPELPTSQPVVPWTLPEVLGGKTPNVVKIDVEGYETRLAPAILPWLSEVGAHVQISIHGASLPTGIGKWNATFLPDERWGDWRLDPR